MSFMDYFKWTCLQNKQARSREEMQQEMELQLHEQYAQNNNANLGSIITLIVTLLAVFYGYGYVYLHSTLEFSEGFEKMYEGGYYTLDALVFTTMAVYVVLGIIYYICYYQGLHQRLEQFITFAIRAKYYRKFHERWIASENLDFPEFLMDDSYNEIFPCGYHPFKICECKNICLSPQCVFVKIDSKNLSDCNKCYKNDDLVQGLFGKLLRVVRFVAVLVLTTFLFKIIANIVYFKDCHSSISWPGIISIILLVGVCIFILDAICKQKKRLVKKYATNVAHYEKILKDN